MQRIFVFLFIISVSSVKAQNLHINLLGGLSNYNGDLQPKKLTLKGIQPAFGAGLLYEITDKFTARLMFTHGTLKAADANSPYNKDRNLSFSSPVNEVSLGVEYDILNLYETSITPYLFTGIAVYHFNPSAIDSNGAKVFLQPLGTEGQGFYLNRQKYSLTQFSLPVGGGIKLALTPNVRLRAEAGIRKTFTDYLDDVSSTYADMDELLLNNGAKAVELAFRGGEIKQGLIYPVAGRQRGNPKSKDLYYFAGLAISFRIQSEYGSRSGRSQLGCPLPVY
jgi:Domain of unknown function (DUF6089)